VDLSYSRLEPIGERYVRDARRLRARWAGQPGRMHRALRDLSTPISEPVPYTRTPAERFANEVIHSMEGGLLRYSVRLKLLRQAAEMGIERFEANLIIAAVQSCQRPQVRIMPKRKHKVLPLVLAFLIVQAVIGIGAWWILRG